MTKKFLISDLHMCHDKVADFVSFPLFRFTLIMKLANFNFVSHSDTLIFFNKKLMLDLNMSCQTVSALV